MAFEVVDLAPGESKRVAFDLSPERLGYFDDAGKLIAPAGMSATLSVGGGQPGYVTEDGAVSTKVNFTGE